MEIQQGVPLSEHCRFRVGGPADAFVEVGGLEPLLEALRCARRRGLRTFLFGAGTNLFFSDQGFRGLVIQFRGGSWEVELGRERVRAGAGVLLGDLVRGVACQGFGGLEFLANIPGSVGGAVAGNAGCYGKALAERLCSATLFDLGRLELLEPVGPGALEFGYRQSRLKRDSSLVLVEASLAVAPRPEAEILSEVASELAVRSAKHPQNEPCAGSFFQNPPSLPAWQALLEAGLAGARVGDACLSPLHANFLVNAGRATSAEILALVRMARGRVRERLGIDLVPEVRYIGPEGPEEMV